VLFGRITIPTTVGDEVAPSIPTLPDWIDVVPHSAASMPEDWPGIDDGERAVLRLAVASRARLVVIDDLAGRTAAIRSGLPITGTAGVLLLAKRAGTIDEVRPLLDRLGEVGFFLGRTVRDSVLAAADEDSSRP
jgi:uncharacterized protein